MQYGGFWIRLGAYLIDFVILLIIQVPLAFVFGANLFETDPAVATSFGAYDILSLVIGLGYFVGFEGSNMQGTPGKRALGLIVTDAGGAKISYLRAVGRYFAKILSAMILLIGFIMVAFTERKQGLHDIIASTLVLKANPGEGGYDPDTFT